MKKLRFNPRSLSLVLATVLAGSPLCALGADSELTSAIKQGETRVVTDLIRRKTDVNAPEQNGTTPLQWAIYQEQPDIVRALLRAGADPELPNREGMTPLSLAVLTGNAEVTKLLLDAGADLNRPLANGETALMMAARTGDLATLQLLIKQGASIDAKENLRGTTALMWAASNRNAPAVRLLIDAGADVSQQSATTAPGRGPYLAPSARSRIRSFYRQIVSDGGVRRTQFGDALTDEDLEHVLSQEELLSRMPQELVEEFQQELARGQQNNERKQWGGLTALHFAVREGDMATVQTLVEAGADVNQVSEYGWSPLLTATQNRFYVIGKYLLDHGADPNIANGGGWNPLYIATDNRNIESGDYPTRQPDMDHMEFIKLLLAHGADPDIRMASSTETRTVFTNQWLNEDGATPFLRAAQSSDLELMKLLLEHGADPGITTRQGITPLAVAAGIAWVEGVTYEWSEDANRETIRWLLELGNDVNAQDSEDLRTALMGAAHKGRTYAIEMLVDAGADLALRDVGSRDTTHNLTGVRWTALDYAEGLVRVGVQSTQVQVEAAQLLRKMMQERGMEVPPEGRTLQSICIVDVCR
jgi:uncharacterized protein